MTTGTTCRNVPNGGSRAAALNLRRLVNLGFTHTSDGHLGTRLARPGRPGVVMTEALRAAIEALDGTDHTRLPAHMVAEIVLSGAATALRRQIEEEMVAPDPGRA